MAPARTLRLLDTGTRTGRENIALDQALIDGHMDGVTPDTLRFLDFSPSVLVGRHQDLACEVDLGFCRDAGIDVGRRVTGGGAIYLDPGQLGWELIVRRDYFTGAALDAIAGQLCEAVAGGLRECGVDVRFRPRNDLEIDGRKVGGTGGFFDRDTLFYQGTIILEGDPDTMFRALRVGAAKRDRHALAAARDRVTSLAASGAPVAGRQSVMERVGAALAASLESAIVPGSLSAAEIAAAAALYRDEIGSDEFVHEIDGQTQGGGWLHAGLQSPGGHVEVHLKCSATRPRRVERALFTGDFFVTPPRTLFDLEAALAGARTDALDEVITAYCRKAEFEVMSVPVADLVSVVTRAVAAERT